MHVLHTLFRSAKTSCTTFGGPVRPSVPKSLDHWNPRRPLDSLGRPKRTPPLHPRDLLLRIPTPDGVTGRFSEVKAMTAGTSRYPSGRAEKQADRRARELPASYRRPLERLDQRRGSAAGATGPLVARLNGYGELLCLVAGAWGDCSTHLYELIITCAESCVAHPCRSTGRPEMDSQLGVITGQYRRLLSSCIVRAQTQRLISRIGVISPEARLAAQKWMWSDCWRGS